MKIAEATPGTYEARVHADRTSGRRRSVASRVLLAGRVQALVAQQGASPKETRSIDDAMHGRREGETVRKHAQAIKRSRSSACGSRLASSGDDERRSRAFAHQAFTGMVARGPTARRSTVGNVVRKEHATGSTSGSEGG